MESGIWRIACVWLEGLAPICLSSNLYWFTKTNLQCPSLPLGAAIAGVWIAIWRECESTYPLNIYSEIQTKKVNRLHFSLFSSRLHNSFTLSMDVIFISHNSGCAISQLPNTVPESVKCFCVYSICSAQYCSTFPSVFEMNKRGRKGKRKQSNCIWETRYLTFVRFRTTFLNTPQCHSIFCFRNGDLCSFPQESHIKASDPHALPPQMGLLHLMNCWCIAGLTDQLQFFQL